MEATAASFELHVAFRPLTSHTHRGVGIDGYGKVWKGNAGGDGVAERFVQIQIERRVQKILFYGTAHNVSR